MEDRPHCIVETGLLRRQRVFPNQPVTFGFGHHIPGTSLSAAVRAAPHLRIDKRYLARQSGYSGRAKRVEAEAPWLDLCKRREHNLHLESVSFSQHIDLPLLSQSRLHFPSPPHTLAGIPSLNESLGVWERIRAIKPTLPLSHYLVNIPIHPLP